MRPDKDGCRCHDETVLRCPVHGTNLTVPDVTITIQHACVCEDPAMESCPLHSTHERCQKLLDRLPREQYQDANWEEVNICDGREMCICLGQEEELPRIFVVRGSQMFRLKWPKLPPTDTGKSSMR